MERRPVGVPRDAVGGILELPQEANTEILAARDIPMQRIVSFLLVLLCAATNLAQVRVRGYFRRDGTYVSPHYRSYPDGSFYNNWSTKGNVNPYTGQPGTKVAPPSGYRTPPYRALIEYYSMRTPGPASATAPPSVPAVPAPSPGPMRLPRGIDSLPVIPLSVAPADVARSEAYCVWLYGRDVYRRDDCRRQQERVLASIVLPDYSGFPQGEVLRGTRYCEWLYGDNRASFYDCLNTQILGLASPEPSFGPTVPHAEISRAMRYCEWLYGDNRASYRDCLDRQAASLNSHWPVRADDLPQGEWQRALGYCEWLYDNNRGGSVACMSDQASKLRAHMRMGAFEAGYDQDARSYCQWLYGNNRAGYWDCLQRR
jgi:hypothetical protein